MNLMPLCLIFQRLKKYNFITGYDLAESIFCYLSAVDLRQSACITGSKLQLFFELQTILNNNLLTLVQGASYIYIYTCTLH
ncbi:hypothetical protein Barb7_00532 [Bacteroidales bacterium Barb7]|nr:hypothetical protein Barb7_00532 [Bacteroidales bacterium Barb7]